MRSLKEVLKKKDVYSLHLRDDQPGPVELEHPETKQRVGSWTYIVRHEQINLFGKKTFAEIFDFAAKKIATVALKTHTISKVEELDDPQRSVDVQKAYAWLARNHPKWFYPLKEAKKDSAPKNG